MDWLKKIKDYKTFLQIERGLSKNSIENYVRDIHKLYNYNIEFKITRTPITIEKNDIQQFIYEIAKVVNPKTQARIISGLRSFFDYLIFEGYREDNPLDLIESPKLSRTLPDVLTDDEVTKLISHIDLSHPQGERNRAIIETIYGCGLRVSEVINLKLSDLFFEEGYIQVLGKGNKYRFVPIHSITIKFINFYIEHTRNHITPTKDDEDTLFLNRRGKKLTRQMIFIVLKDLAAKSNLNKNIGPHTLRHSFATYLLKEGVDLRAIQQLLGHESITTTEIYVHLDRSHLQKVVEKYHPRNR
ncbi:site-specific tyrosine recombinase/integron integrase [Tenacibaculum jejuense]|uniref:Tyrosine recombinase XerC n=1 Tax=Tenacibaculum jejuense TaxID=584609 RepID=A0A238U911_9FLAO|nr:site-specific tyrosine recombinase/integron integrase [Tenacibaculum jejuense]SNR15679.1 Tyrosine recombinase XerD [Tenacibaculum jejuense]